MTTPEQRPRLFIGSSTESLTLAYEIQSALEYSCEPTVWTQGVFQLTRSSLESLRTALDDYDFAVFVLAPDDLSTLRDTQQLTVRDNVLLELGLFLGKLGSDCVFMVAPREEPGGLRLPTDLLGIHVGTYEQNRSDGNCDCRRSQPRETPHLHTVRRSCCDTGNERMRLPVAAKMALRTAGAATPIVGSPTPPQKPPDGTRTVSTFGISSMRMTG